MRVVTVTEAKNGLSALIDVVRTGETVLIVDRGRPVARLETAVAASDVAPGGRLARLERAGLVRVATQRPQPLHRLEDSPHGSGVLQALIEERRSGR